MDFVVRQKEEFLPDGTILGRPWSFERLETSKLSDSAIPDRNTSRYEFKVPPSTESRKYQQPNEAHRNHGKIEVVVLRCYPASDDDNIEVPLDILAAPTMIQNARGKKKVVRFALGSRKISKKEAKSKSKSESNDFGTDRLNDMIDGVSFENNIALSSISNEGNRTRAYGHTESPNVLQNFHWERSFQGPCENSRAANLGSTVQTYANHDDADSQLPDNHQPSQQEKIWQDQEFISTTPLFTYVRPVVLEDNLVQSSQDQGQPKVLEVSRPSSLNANNSDPV